MSTISFLLKRLERNVNGNRNYAESETIMENLCFQCRIPANYPKYNQYNNIRLFYNAVVNWLSRVGLIE